MGRLVFVELGLPLRVGVPVVDRLPGRDLVYACDELLLEFGLPE